MIRLKWLAVGVFTLFLAGLSSPAPTAAADTSAQRAEEQTAAMQLTNIRITYTRARDAIFDVLRAQQVYSIERANEDEMGMRTAAAAMLMSLAESRFWMARLDAQVTESQFGAEIDKDVTDLRSLVTNAFNAIAVDLFSNNLDAINAAMDKSANEFNTLARSNQNLMAKLWPRLSADQ
jgi:hypothetical protein